MPVFLEIALDLDQRMRFATGPQAAALKDRTVALIAALRSWGTTAPTSDERSAAITELMELQRLVMRASLPRG